MGTEFILLLGRQLILIKFPKHKLFTSVILSVIHLHYFLDAHFGHSNTSHKFLKVNSWLYGALRHYGGRMRSLRSLWGIHWPVIHQGRDLRTTSLQPCHSFIPILLLKQLTFRVQKTLIQTMCYLTPSAVSTELATLRRGLRQNSQLGWLLRRGRRTARACRRESRRRRVLRLGI